MATVPGIETTAARRLLPTATLDVKAATPAAFGAAIGQGVQQIGEAGAQTSGAIANFQLAKQQEEQRLAEFDRQTSFVNFGSDQTTKLEEAARNVSGPAQGFTQDFMTGFDADAQKFLEGVPERDRHAWSARMAQYRSSVANGALKTEFGQRDAWSKATIGDTLQKLQSGATMAPDKLDDWRKQGDDIISSSLLSPEDKLEAGIRWHADVSVAAATGDVQRDPEGAIKRLGGTAREVTEGVVTKSSADVASKIINVESGGNPNAQSKTSSASGLGQFTDSTWLSLYKQKIGAAGKTDAEILALKSDANIGRQMTQFAVDEHKADLGAAHLPATDANVYMLHFLGPDKGTALLKATPDTPVSQVLPASWITANKSVLAGKTVGQVEAWAAAKMGGGAAPAKPGAASASPAEAPALDPRYADMPYEARQQLIGAAQREIDRRQAVAAAGQQQAHASWLNNFLNEINDGKAGTADIEAARKSGALTDFDEIHRAQTIVEERDKKAADLNYFNGAMATPGFTWNPYDDKQKKGVEAAVKQMAGSAGPDGKPIGPAAAAFSVWQRTGILADSGAAALRGGLISTNPQQVQVSANIAGNMVRRNPNAFAAVQGGDDMERAALSFNHYTYDLGMAPDQAAARVAQENTPEFKSKIKIAQPELDEYRKQLRKEGADDASKAAFGGVKFLTPAKALEANDTYSEMVVDNLRAGKDMSTAKALAVAQMQKVYGLSRNGTEVMKYPPEKGYPSIGGSHDYVYADAVQTVKHERGVDVAPVDVHLVPIAGVTDQDFRTGKTPRYALVYGHPVNGQMVLDRVPGFFAADTHAAAKATGLDRKAEFEQAQKTPFITPEQRKRYTGRFGGADNR